MSDFVSVLLYMVTVVGLTAVILFLASVLGPKSLNPAKAQPFETGNPPTPGSPRAGFPVHFYLVAILFVVFDVEIAFLYPWAVAFRNLGWLGLAEMLVFVAILTFGWWFVVKRGVLEWR